MKIDGQCHCGKIQFSCDAYAPVPYMHCYCSICRKTAGGGGYSINLGAWTESLTVTGEDNLGVYQAVIDGKQSAAQRKFCRACGTFLWAFDPRWPELIHPFASCIDTPLPEPPERVHIMLQYKAPWAQVPEGEGNRHFDEYPDESLADWHTRWGF
ncbi:MAG TPA: GFA family protein [Gammaproteobacteria bacterium]|nr:GFA family protein [Gammaproteobacteria bacterium]